MRECHVDICQNICLKQIGQTLKKVDV